MKIHEYNEMMSYLTRPAQPIDRQNKAIGGGAFEGTDLGTREGFAKLGKIEQNPEFQKQVKDLLDQGFSNREVAEKLNRGLTTIKRVKDEIKYPSKKQEIADETSRRYTKLKELVEEANRGPKLVYQKDLAKSVGIKSLDTNFRKQYKKFNIPELDGPADKAQKEFLKIIKNPETPIEDTFSLVKKISERTGVGASKVSEHLLKLPEYKDANKMLKTLAQVEFQKKIQGKGFTLGDFEEIIQQKKDAPKLQVSSISTPEKFIIDSAMRHQAVGGDKITFIKKPGDIDRQGNLITHRDAEFEFKGKKYSYYDLLKDGRKNPEFKDVYKVADDLNEFLGKEVIHPVTKEKVIFKNLMKEAYNKGAGYGYERAPYDIDHSKSVKEEPFKNVRVLPRRINTSQGIMMNLADTAKKGLLGEEASSKYTPEKIKEYSKKMGYDFNKNINQLFKDELKLAEDILVKGRVLKTPLDIAKESLVDKKRLNRPMTLGAAGDVELAKDILTKDFQKLKSLYGPQAARLANMSLIGGLGSAGAEILFLDASQKAGLSPQEIVLNMATAGVGTQFKDLQERADFVRQKGFGNALDSALRKQQISQNVRPAPGLPSAFGAPQELTPSEQEALKIFNVDARKPIDERRALQAAEYKRQEQTDFNDPMFRETFSDGSGPKDPSKRKFIKVMGGLASIPVFGKFFKVAEKAAPLIEKIKTPYLPGKPEWFDKLVNRVIAEGEDVTKRFSTQDRQVVHKAKINETDEVTVYQNLDDGQIDVIYDSPTNMGEESVNMTFKPGIADETTKGRKPPDEFRATETEPQYVGGPEDADIEFIGEGGGSDIRMLESDITPLKQFAGEKVTMKETLDSIKRNKSVEKINNDTMEQAEYIAGKYGDVPEPDIDDFID